MTAPGDTVNGRITREHHGWDEGELLEIAEASPQRAVPVCSLYGSCGGCSLQHLSYEAQITEKSAILRDAMTRIGGYSVLPELGVRRSPPFEYRNRVQLHCIPRHTPGDTVFGFKGRRSAEIVPAADCPVADPAIRLVLRENAGSGTAAGREKCRLASPPGKSRFTLYGRGDLLLQEGGESRGKTGIRGRDILIDAGVFFQSNAAMLEVLIGDLSLAAGDADRSRPMADIYCGVGTFAAFLGEGFPRIDLIEENRNSLDLARRNAAGKKCRFFPITDEQWACEAGQSAKGRPYGFAVVDPPRQGLSRGMRRWLREAGPPLLAYVSCDPAILARDSGELKAGGYELISLGFYDFYPQTAHIESLAVFKREEP
jgi:23S rRNA (uracil1939-C5)-methyltransferase